MGITLKLKRLDKHEALPGMILLCLLYTVQLYEYNALIRKYTLVHDTKEQPWEIPVSHEGHTRDFASPNLRRGREEKL
jgi:hypothetical protein